ncbi:MAG TPA: hypothetical protein VN922_16650 [Bacteroidia bacterium]|nr:hypothetical protein [Bacteroidia bacterium]
MKYSHFMMQGIALLAAAQVGADKFSTDLKSMALDKWEKSKQLPRKAKKLMRKDALLDYSIGESAAEFSNNLFNF